MRPAQRDKVLITENPCLRPGHLFRHAIGEGLFRAFYGKDASLFYFGRGALWQGIRSLRLSPSDVVLVPAYHCGVEVEAVSMAGVRLRYYDVGEDLAIDPADLKSRFDAHTRAVLLIHYFGFPQPVEAIREICAASKVLLVEDCSQALFSSCMGRPLGTFGDMAVFSQRKTLPLPDGGALLVNNPELAPEHPDKTASACVAIKKTMGMLFRATFNLSPRDELPYPFERMVEVINRRITRNAGTRYSTGMGIDIDRCSMAMSGIARQIMDRTRIEEVVQRRRDNYDCLSRRLSDTAAVGIVRPALPEGACPLFLPVRIRGIARRDLQLQLMGAGIGAFVFGETLHPTLPPGQFTHAEMLSQEILCLPVHQDLAPGDMAYMAEAVQRTAGELEHASTH
jgi:dTDP-4-amino-4,6-dideoxygalactose transaminase